MLPAAHAHAQVAEQQTRALMQAQTRNMVANYEAQLRSLQPPPRPHNAYGVFTADMQKWVGGCCWLFVGIRG